MKTTVVKIDLRIWTTQAKKARELGVTPQAISNQIARGLMDAWHIPELNLTLVKK